MRALCSLSFCRRVASIGRRKCDHHLEIARRSSKKAYAADPEKYIRRASEYVAKHGSHWRPEYGVNVRDPERHKHNCRAWALRNPMDHARISRRYTWKHQGIIGFTTDDYEKMHAHQSGKCAICSREVRLYGTARNDGDACVDHDKMTGRVRGILCRRCNLGLGFLGDNLQGIQRAEAYLSGGVQCQ